MALSRGSDNQETENAISTLRKALQFIIQEIAVNKDKNNELNAKAKAYFEKNVVRMQNENSHHLINKLKLWYAKSKSDSNMSFFTALQTKQQHTDFLLTLLDKLPSRLKNGIPLTRQERATFASTLPHSKHIEDALEFLSINPYHQLIIKHLNHFEKLKLLKPEMVEHLNSAIESIQNFTYNVDVSSNNVDFRSKLEKLGKQQVLLGIIINAYEKMGVEVSEQLLKSAEDITNQFANLEYSLDDINIITDSWLTELKAKNIEGHYNLILSETESALDMYRDIYTETQKSTYELSPTEKTVNMLHVQAMMLAKVQEAYTQCGLIVPEALNDRIAKIQAEKEGIANRIAPK